MKSTINNSPLAISIREAALMLGVASQTLYNQISAGNCPIRTFKFGGRRLVSTSDILALVGRSDPNRPQTYLQRQQSTAQKTRLSR
ncbi:helix-turn-helix domain-containing protein [Actimicrobium antarcticum]|uniref:helix-turn-helix domain-containing protein n=1 Tax=Actimicrobium antarcticum TaxID=1051899 RepID=UPI003CD0A3ED